MYQTILKDFDIRMLMDSGQVFRIAPCGEDCYTVTAGDHFVCLRCAGHQDAGCGKDGAFVEFSCTEEEFLSFWHNYFDLSLDYGAIKETVDPEDAFLQAAVAYGSGIRILRQDLWETIISFLISQNNNMKRSAPNSGRSWIRTGIRCHFRRTGLLPGLPFIPFPRLKPLPPADWMGCRSWGWVTGINISWPWQNAAAARPDRNSWLPWSRRIMMGRRQS